MSKKNKIGLAILITGIILSVIGFMGVRKTNATGYHWTLAIGLILIGSGGTILVLNNENYINGIILNKIS